MMSPTIPLKGLKTDLGVQNNDFETVMKNGTVSQFFVFEGEDYLGWDCFNKSKVSVGSSKLSDLVLNGKYISDIHALFYFKGDQIIVSDKGSESGVRVNGKAIETCILGSLDVVSIGTYTLKIRVKKRKDLDEEISELDNQTFENEMFLSDSQSTNVEDSVEDVQYQEVEVFIGDAPDEGNQDTGVEDREILNTQASTSEISLSEIHTLESDVEIPIDETEDMESLAESISSDDMDLPVIETAEAETSSPEIEIAIEDTPDIEEIADDVSDDEIQIQEIESLAGETSQQQIEIYQDEIDVSDEETTDLETPEQQIEIYQDEIDVSDEETTDLETSEQQIEIYHDETDAIDIDTLNDESSTFETTEGETDDITTETIILSSATEELNEPLFGRSFTEIEEEDDDEEDEPDDEPDVQFLKEKLANYTVFEPKNNKEKEESELVLEVVKYRENNVVDVCFLNKRDKYICHDGNGKFCLAENKNSENSYFYFNEQLTVKIQDDLSNQTIIDSSQNYDQIYNQKNLHNKRKKIYRELVPENGNVIVSDGYHEYFLRKTLRAKSPEIVNGPKKEIEFHKHLLKSAGFHIIFLIFLGIIISLTKTSDQEIQNSRFVKIDTSQFKDQLQPVKKKKQPVKRQKPVVKKQKISAKKQLAKKQTKKYRKRTASKRKGKVGKGRTSRSPKAGGGSGKAGGNVSNRNIKQAGILGALGISNGVGLMPKQAIAAVTNLDAVSSARGGRANFKVGGIVGKLGKSKISVPTGGVVTTKGSVQVLRSAGIKGKGSVAALAKGQTGKNQVMALVSANLDKKVRIKGGMSREAVKKVIDQHMDEISYCYESALVSNPSIMGKVIFEWKILASGRVGEVRIKSSTINSSEIHTCIKQAIKSWRFPKPKGSEVVVSYPFIFDIVGF